MKTLVKRIFKTLLCSLLIGFSSPVLSEEISISAQPIKNFLSENPNQNQFGKLEFLGGLILESRHEEFGGFSAMRFMADNQLVILSDKARVVTARLERNNNKPLGLENAKITRIKASNGRTITDAEDKDAEGLEISGNSFFVGYERNDRIMRFSMSGQTLIANNDYNVDLNPQGFPKNKGPEAIAIQPATGMLYVFAEQALDEDGNHRGVVISGGKIIRKLSVKYRDSFSLTDAVFLPNGDLILLERYYNPFTGVFMRMRRIKSGTLETDSPLDGEILIDVSYTHEIDNMEGLAATKMQDGSTRLTLISDDNFSRNQRTVLLEFKLDN